MQFGCLHAVYYLANTPASQCTPCVCWEGSCCGGDGKNLSLSLGQCKWCTSLQDFGAWLFFFLSDTCVLLGYISQHNPQDSVGLSPWCPSLVVWTPFPLHALTYWLLSPIFDLWMLNGVPHGQKAGDSQWFVEIQPNCVSWGDQAQEIDLKFLTNECFEHHLITSWRGKGKRQLINYLLWIICSAVMVIKQSLQIVSFR